MGSRRVKKHPMASARPKYKIQSVIIRMWARKTFAASFSASTIPIPRDPCGFSEIDVQYHLLENSKTKMLVQAWLNLVSLNRNLQRRKDSIRER